MNNIVKSEGLQVLLDVICHFINIFLGTCLQAREAYIDQKQCGRSGKHVSFLCFPINGIY